MWAKLSHWEGSLSLHHCVLLVRSQKCIKFVQKIWLMFACGFQVNWPGGNGQKMKTLTSWRSFSSLFCSSRKYWKPTRPFWTMLPKSLASSTSWRWINFRARVAWTWSLCGFSASETILTDSRDWRERKAGFKIIIFIIFVQVGSQIKAPWVQRH